jgi:hypothetical protein
MVTSLTVVCIGVYLDATVGTRCLAYGLATLSAEHGFRLIDGPTIGTRLASCLLLLLSLLGGHIHGYSLVWPDGML